MVPEFVNEPLTDFSATANRAALEAALSRAANEGTPEHPLVIGGQRIVTDGWIESLNPARKGESVGRVARADQARAEAALVASERAFGEWARFPADERARVLLRIAGRLRKRKLDLVATMIREIGKTWVEADADLAEAIDFCEFYAREMLRLAAPQPVTTLRGNDTELIYVPLGPGVAIPPWNFPAAIATGLVVSAVVAGNTVVFKPASLTPIIAAQIFALF